MVSGTIDASADARATARPGAYDHIVDRLIAERAPNLAGGWAWPVLRPLLYRILDYARARRMADAIAPMGGAEALAYVSALLRVQVSVIGLERLPRLGRLVMICNHPTGIADGVAVYDALKGARPDLMFYANSDAHRVAPRFDEVLIPVEWVEDKRTRERTRLTLQMTRAAMEAERALVIFPAGRLARRGRDGVIADPAWAPSAFSVARKYEATVVPLHLSGPRSSLFHFFDNFSGELRDITLFHELLNKRGKAFRLIVGHPVPAGLLPADAVEATAAMKHFVEQILPRDPDRRFA
jgi:putative hemolysin